MQVLPLGEMDGGVRRVGWASRPVSRTDLFCTTRRRSGGVWKRPGSPAGCDEGVVE